MHSGGHKLVDTGSYLGAGVIAPQSVYLPISTSPDLLYSLHILQYYHGSFRYAVVDVIAPF